MAKKNLDKCMEKCTVKAYRLIERYLDELMQPEKIEKAPVNQLSSAIGTVMDRFVKPRGDADSGMIEDMIKELSK